MKKILKKKEIKKRVKALGKEITKDYKNKTPLLAICVLKGAFPFFSDLVRNIDLDLTTEFIFAESYRGSEEQGRIEIDVSRIGSTLVNIRDKNILLIDDIFDTGNTIKVIKREIEYLSPASLKSCTFLLKKTKKQNIKPDYYCFEVPEDVFYVGYGMDYEQLNRNLPFVLGKKKMCLIS